MSEIINPFLAPITGNFVDDCFDLAKILDTAARRNARLSEAFYIVGNEKLSREFDEERQLMQEVADRIRKICSERTSLDYSETQASAGNMLAACLAGVKMQTSTEIASA